MPALHITNYGFRYYRTTVSTLEVHNFSDNLNCWLDELHDIDKYNQMAFSNTINTYIGYYCPDYVSLVLVIDVGYANSTHNRTIKRNTKTISVTLAYASYQSLINKTLWC